MKRSEIIYRAQSGWIMVMVVVVLATIDAAVLALSDVIDNAALAVVAAIGLAGILFLCGGFFVVAPNTSKVLVLVGRYRGTVRTDGFWWANPLLKKETVSLKIRNFDSDVLKVNDAVGNPVEIAAVVTWQVIDTAAAAFDVEDYESFVSIQTETAVRHAASEYPYDNWDADDAPSLRANADEVTATLQAELQERLETAGVAVVDTRLRRLAYAPEIAGEMLKRQQANAIVAARQRIVEGAVGMVDHALQMLAAQEIVDLDEERKAAMVSNLLVVLCSDRGAQPVVNSGSLYG